MASGAFGGGSLHQAFQYSILPNGSARAIRADMNQLKLKVDELAASYSGLLKIAASQGGASVRLDRRVERVEKRLDLVEA